MADHDETHEGALVRLLGAAEGIEARVIMRAAARAGLMWRCACSQSNYLSHERCAECRRPRPDDEREAIG